MPAHTQRAGVPEEGHDQGSVPHEPMLRELLRRHGRVALEQRQPDGAGIHGRGCVVDVNGYVQELWATFSKVPDSIGR